METLTVFVIVALLLGFAWTVRKHAERREYEDAAERCQRERQRQQDHALRIVNGAKR